MDRNFVCQFEGDSTQRMTFTRKCGEYLFDAKVKLCVGRVQFAMGDLDDYWDQVEARLETIDRNAQKIAAFDLGVGSYQSGAWIWESRPVAGDLLETVPSAPTYSGDLSLTLSVYAENSGGTMALTNTITVDHNQIFKFNPGIMSRKWQYELSGNVEKVIRVDLASSVDEIKRRQQQVGV